MKFKRRIVAMVLTICVAMSIPMSVVTAAPKAEPKATGAAEVLTTSAKGDNDHLRLTQTAKWLDKQKTEAEVTFKLESDLQMVGTPKRQDIIFVVDQSNTMSGERTERVQESLSESIATLLAHNLDNRIGLVQFGSNATVLSELTDNTSTFNTAIYTMSLDGGTYYALGLNAAKEMLDARTDTSRESVIIFMSDGGAMDRDEAIQAVMNQLRANRVETYAVQYLAGSEISSYIRQVADKEERAYNADKLDSISTIYREVIGQVTGAKAYTDMKLDIPVDTDNYTIVSGTSNNGAVSVSADKAIWTVPKYYAGNSAEVKLRLKLRDTTLEGYLNNFAQTNLTYTDPTVTGTQTVPIDTTVLDRVFYTLHFNGNLNTDGTAPNDRRVLGGTEVSLPYNPKGLTKAGDVFTGWSLGGVQQPQTFMMPANDTALDAVWGKHEIELNTTTFAPVEVFLMKRGLIKDMVSGAEQATKVEFVSRIDKTKTVVDLSEANDGSIGAWIEGDTLYIGCSQGPISLPPVSQYLFSGLTAATEINFKNWVRTDQVTNMYRMFMDCVALTSLDVSSFDTSQVTNMSWMFYSCKALTSLDLSSFDTSRVTGMESMFRHCTALTSLDLSSFDTGMVTNMQTMFGNCAALTSLDLSGFDMSEVRRVTGMFTEAGNLKTVYVRSEDDKAKITRSGGFPKSAQVIVGQPPEVASTETDTSVETNSAVTEEETTTKAVAKANTRATTDPTLIDGRKIKQNDQVDYEITVKYHATAVSQSNRIKVTNKMPEGMTCVPDSVVADGEASRIVENDGGKVHGDIENLKVENNVLTFDAVGLSDGAKIRVGYKTTATKVDESSYYEFLNQASGTLQGLGKDSNFVRHYYATLPAQQYTLTYEYAPDLPTGAPAVRNPKDYAEDQEINLPTPSMPGYVFNGWKENDVAVANPYTMPTNDVTLTGSWTAVDVTDTDILANVTYEFAGDTPSGITPPPGGSYTVGTNAGGKDIWGVMVDIPTITAPDGYTFDGWTSGKVSAGDITNGSFTLGEESVVLKGNWTKSKYKVTYKYQNEAEGIPADAPALPADATYEWGTKVDTAKAPQDTATANFEGWMSDNNIESDFATTFTMPQEDVVLFGLWTKAADFTVTYQYDDTKPKPADAPTLSVDKGNEGDTKIAYAPTSTDIRDGKGNYGTWTIDKWTSPDLAGDVNAGDTYTMPDKSITLTGAWTFNIDKDYREVRFKIKNGTWADGTTDEIIVPVKLVGGVATLDAAKVPTGMNANTGYGLGKWDVTPNTDPDAVTDDVTYTYKFTKTAVSDSSSDSDITGSGTTPPTGDNNMFTILLSLVGIALSAIIALVVVKARKQKNRP